GREMEADQAEVPGGAHGQAALNDNLLPQSEIEGDVARSRWESDRADPAMVRFEGDDEHGEGETIDLEARGMGPHRDEVARQVRKRGGVDRTREIGRASGRERG